MISENEITKGKEVPPELQENLKILLERVNKLRSLWGKPMIVTSGYRSMLEHLEIYRKKGIAPEKVPLHSHHLYCEACDFADEDGSLKAFVKANDYQVLKDCELWMEDGSTTTNWCHVQIVPPKSGQREFMP